MVDSTSCGLCSRHPAEMSRPHQMQHRPASLQHRARARKGKASAVRVALASLPLGTRSAGATRATDEHLARRCSCIVAGRGLLLAAGGSSARCRSAQRTALRAALRLCFRALLVFRLAPAHGPARQGQPASRTSTSADEGWRARKGPFPRHAVVRVFLAELARGHLRQAQQHVGCIHLGLHRCRARRGLCAGRGPLRRRFARGRGRGRPCSCTRGGGRGGSGGSGSACPGALTRPGSPARGVPVPATALDAPGRPGATVGARGRPHCLAVLLRPRGRCCAGGHDVDCRKVSLERRLRRVLREVGRELAARALRARVNLERELLRLAIHLARDLTRLGQALQAHKRVRVLRVEPYGALRHGGARPRPRGTTRSRTTRGGGRQPRRPRAAAAAAPAPGPHAQRFPPPCGHAPRQGRRAKSPSLLLSAPPRQMEHESVPGLAQKQVVLAQKQQKKTSVVLAQKQQKKTEKKILGGLPPPAKGVGCGRGRSAEGGAAQDTHVAAMDEFGEGDVCLLPRVPRPRPRAARPRPRPAPPRPDFSRARSTSTLAAQRQ